MRVITKVRGLLKRERGGWRWRGGRESNKKRKRRRQKNKESQGQTRKRDEGIMRREAGNEKKMGQKKGVKGGDGARFAGEGPGGKVKEERRPKDLYAALPGQESQQQEALPWQAASSAHMQIHCTHMHTHIRGGKST